MTRPDEHPLMTGIAPGFSVVEFDPNWGTPIGGNDGGDQGGFIPLLSANYVHELTDSTRLGLGLFSNSGAVLDPRNGWVGRAQTTEVTLFTVSIQPTIAVKVTDWLSVGAGPCSSTVHLTRSSAPLVGGAEGRIKLKDMDDSAVGEVASVFIEPSDDWRIGLVYQEELNLTMAGDVKLGVGVGGTVDLDFDFLRRLLADAYWQATDDLALLFSLCWEGWSTLDQTVISLTVTATLVRFGL